MDDSHKPPDASQRSLALTRLARNEMEGEYREVSVALDDMKFSAAHFVAFKGFREPLHGHNYTVGLRIGGNALQADGYLTDFGDLKRSARHACRRLNHCTILPTRSDVLQIREASDGNGGGQVEIRCENSVSMTLPLQDCVLLPIVHSTAEEIAEYLWWDILVTESLGQLLMSRGLRWMEVSVSERPGQGAKYRNFVELSASLEGRRSAFANPPRTPQPCLPGCSAEAAGGTETSARSSARQQHQICPPCRWQPSAVGGKAALEPSADEVAEAAFKSLLSTLGTEEASRPELDRTPARAAKAFREMTSGLRVSDPLAVVGKGLFDIKEAQELVAVRDITFHSMCEHHLLPFSGICHVAYFPAGRVLGLSKFPRLLEVFARRLQLQERLTAQFADGLTELLRPKALAVAIQATHGCMCHRGVGMNANTRTLCHRGLEGQDREMREQLREAVRFSADSQSSRL